MLYSEQKPFEELRGYFKGESSLFIVGCKGCAEGCQSGGEAQVKEIKDRLEKEGKKVTGFTVIDMVCDHHLSRLKLAAHQKAVSEADSILVMTCGAGIQTIAELADRIVHPGCNTISMGGAHAEWKEAERCLECGDCLLEFTGGICPIARCSKHLLNGPCGGSKNGKCEVSADIPCAWQLIVERLTALGQLSRLEKIVPPKNWSVSLIAGRPVKRN